MQDIKYPVDCPLLGRLTDMDTCFDIHMVVCGEAPEWTAHKEIYPVDGFRERSCFQGIVNLRL